MVGPLGLWSPEAEQVSSDHEYRFGSSLVDKKIKLGLYTNKLLC